MYPYFIVDANALSVEIEGNVSGVLGENGTEYSVRTQ